MTTEDFNMHPHQMRVDMTLHPISKLINGVRCNCQVFYNQNDKTYYSLIFVPHESKEAAGKFIEEA